MRDERTGGGAGDGTSAPVDRSGEPLTLEQLIARQGAGPSGRRAARRTGEVPIPLLPGESLPAHRGPRPAVPAPDASRRPAPAEEQGPRRGLPPVPAAAAPAAPTPAAPAPAAPTPAASAGVRHSTPIPPLPGGDGVRHSTPIPPLPGGGPVRHSGPVPPLPGGGPIRHSAPVPPLPGQPPRKGAPLPPIPGLDAPGRSGATAARPPGRRETRAARRAARSPARRRLIRAAIGLAALVGVVVAYHVGLYFYVDQSIERVEALAPDGQEVVAPGLQEGSATYLVVGTGLPGAEGPAAVATLLAHVSAEGDRAVLLSVPPTALVDTPQCRDADGDLREPTTEAFAASLLDGGPACMVRAVQQLSGLRVDHYLGVDLGRLPAMVDALDGISVCLTAPSPAVAASARPLEAGTTELDGAAAGDYLRPGDSGADVTGAATAERAQLLLTSTLRRAMSMGVLGNPVTLTSFLTRAADALTVDEQTNLGDLRTLAGTLGDLSGDQVQRAGLPVAQVGYVPVGTDQAYVVLDAPATRALFETVIEDGRLPDDLVATDDAADDAAAAETAPDAPATGAEQPPATPAVQPLTVAPGAITVDVLNGTGTSGLAATVADALRAGGFVVGQVGNEPGDVSQTVVRHAPGALEAARTVAAAVPGAVLQASDSIGDGVQLVIGPGYSTVVPVQVGAPVAAAVPETPAADTAAQPSTEPASSTTPVTC
ncbi:LCP family protein [Blastococcus sp. SYSU D00820]